MNRFKLHSRQVIKGALVFITVSIQKYGIEIELTIQQLNQMKKNILGEGKKIK
jgi:hypothetical protein